jgi:hypothetical protein
MGEPTQRFRDLDPAVQEAIKKKVRALGPACTELLDALAPKLSESDLEAARAEAFAGEWGVMLNWVSALLISRPVPVTSAERDLLKRALTIIGDDPGGTFRYLQDREWTLAALTMLDAAGEIVAPSRPHPPAPPPVLRFRKGGHLYGSGLPHKTTFPPSWDADRINAEVLDVARNPDVHPLQDRNGGWLTRSVRGGVEIEVRLRPTGPIMIGYPVAGPGVHRTDATGVPRPLEGDPAVTGRPPSTSHLPSDQVVREQRIREIDELHRLCTGLVDAIAARLPGPDRDRVRIGLHVGEWLFLLDDLCAALIQERILVTAAERDQLAAAMVLAGSDPDTPTLRDPDGTLAALAVSDE